MTITKYKYYFRKPKSAITKDIFKWLCVAGCIAIATSSPYFVRNVIRSRANFKKYSNRKVSSTFDRLRREGFLTIKTHRKQIYISLTEKGRQKAGMFQIDSLVVKRPKRWDKKWRLIIFDITEKSRVVREALRGKLKDLGFRRFQKSVWIHPFDCSAEIELLKDFFNLSDKEVQLVVVEKIKGDYSWRKIFGL